MIRKMLFVLGMFFIGMSLQARAQICPPMPTPQNGCSAPKFIQALTNFQFTSACNQHDTCYGTLGRDRGGCDSHFYDDARYACWPYAAAAWFDFGASFALCLDYASLGYAAVVSQGEPFYVQAQQLSAANSIYIGQMVNTDQCGTTPDRVQLYSDGMLSYVTNSFAARAGRSPTPYEFFGAINFYYPASDPGYWQSGVDIYASSVANIHPPAVGYTKAMDISDSFVTFTADPYSPSVAYEWHLNSPVSQSPSVTYPLPTPFHNLVIVDKRGFLKATGWDGAKNMAIVDEQFYRYPQCPPRPANCY